MRFWQFFRDERVEAAVMIVIPMVVALIVLRSLPQLTIITTFVLIGIFVTFTVIRHRQREFRGLQDLARKLNVITGNARPVIEGTSDLAIRRIALQLLQSNDVMDALGKGVAGWKAFFHKYGDVASEDFNRFTVSLSGFIERPGDGARFQHLMRDFRCSLLSHYTTLQYFYELLKDVGIEKVPHDIENKCKSFRQEYDSFVQSVRGIADELDRVSGASLKGTVLLDFADQLENRYGISFPSRYA